MFDKVNLNDPKYLQDYENQIRKLPLDELYEVLDIVKKDKTSERIDIVNKRIGELETSDRLLWAGLLSTMPLPELPSEEKIYRKGGLTAEDLEEVKKTVDETYEKHKDVEIIGYTSSGRYIRPVYDSKYNIEQGKTHETIQRLQKESRENFKWLILLGSVLAVVLLIVVKVIESVFNVDINLRGLH